MFSTTLSLATLPLRLTVRGPFDRARFHHRFGPYEVASGEAPVAHLRVIVAPQGKLLVPADVPYPGVKAYAAPGGTKLMREGLAMWVGDEGEAEAWVRGPEKFPPLPYSEDGGPAETPLRLLTTLALLDHGRGALLHACGYADERGALLFLGQSGAGKTTLARSLPAAGVLSDDQVALLRGEPLALAATPFVGVLGRTIPPCRVPLRAVVVLDHERRGQLHRVADAARAAVVLGCLPLYARTPRRAQAALQIADELQGVPMLRGSFDQQEGSGPWLERIRRASE